MQCFFYLFSILNSSHSKILNLVVKLWKKYTVLLTACPVWAIVRGSLFQYLFSCVDDAFKRRVKDYTPGLVYILQRLLRVLLPPTASPRLLRGATSMAPAVGLQMIQHQSACSATSWAEPPDTSPAGMQEQDDRFVTCLLKTHIVI